MPSKNLILREGIYPEPIGSIGLSRIDVRDIADAAVHALVGPKHRSGTYSLVGPDVITGDSAAETYSRHLTKNIRYAGNDLHLWRKRVSLLLPQRMIEDLSTMFRYFQDYGLRATYSELAQTRDILHRGPRRFDSFVAEAAQSWRPVA